MREISKRRTKSIKKYFEDKEEIKKLKGSQFSHRSPTGDRRNRQNIVQMMAQNVDQMIIVSSFILPPLKTVLIDRFLVMARHENVTPVIVLNKIDLLDSVSELETVVSTYRNAGHTVIPTSSHTGEGIDDLRNVIRGRSSLLAGHSGVGKSSLLNGIEPNLIDKPEVKEISHYSGKGKHTTTSIKLYRLADGSRIFDLPGIKIASFTGIDSQEIQDSFQDFYRFTGSCRFRNCRHTVEPDCAVKNAVEEGLISVDRYESYLKSIGKTDYLFYLKNKEMMF